MTSETALSEPRALAKRRYKEEILEAAQDVFSDKGYQAAQMGEIAQRARVAVGTLYNFFANKENLYREMLMSHVLDIAMEFNEIFESDDDPHTKLLRYIRHKGELFQGEPKLVRLYFSEVQAAELNLRATMSGEFRDLHRKMMGQVTETFQAGIDQGLFVPGDAFAMATALSSITNSFLRLWLNHPDRRPTYLDRVETITQIFFGPVLNPALAAAGARPVGAGNGGSQP